MAQQTPPPRKRVVKRVVRKPVAVAPATQRSRPSPPSPSPARPSRPSFSRPSFPRPSFPRPALSRPSLDRLRQIAVPAAPDVPAPAASAAVGAVVGLLVTASAALALAIFSAVRGTATGGGWGLLTLAAILALAVVVATRLLAYARVLEPGTTALVGLLFGVIVVLAALIDLVYTGWAWLIVPAVGAAAYLVAHLLIVALTPGDD